MLKHIKIFYKILLSCLFITAIPLAGFIYQITENGLEQKNTVEKSLLQSSNVISAEINGWVDKNLRNTQLLSNIDAFKDMDAEAQVPILKAAKENLEWVSLIFVKDPEGDAVARSDGKALRNYSDREYFQQVMDGQKIGQQVLIGKLQPVPLHCFAIPIEKQVDDTVGIITQCSSLVAISEYVTSTRIGYTGYAFLVDSKQRLIAHGEKKSELFANLQSFEDHPALQLPEKKVSILEHEGAKRVFVTLSVGPGWTLVVQQDYHEAYRNYLESKDNALILAAVTIVMVLLFAFLVSYNISSPIKQLTSAADLISKGQPYDEIVGQDRKDEVGDLAKAVSRLAKTIDIAIRRLRQMKKN